jgi:hypothetical protein
MATFQCQACGNLHGAPVEACGMCGNPAVMLVPDDTPAPAGPTAPGTATPATPLGMTAEQTDQVHEALIDFLTSGAAFFRQNTPTVREPHIDGGSE